MAKAVTITDENFQDVVLNSDKPVLVDFWATWCGPCIMMAPIVDQLAGDYDGKVIVGKLDVDANPMVSAKFGIRSIPTMLVFKGGKVVDKMIGATSKSNLVGKLEPQLA